MSDGFVIILEGCDKTGKTTMAGQLSAMLGWPVKKFSQPGPEGPVKEYMYAVEHVSGPFIADRFHLGESVYGPLYRGTPPMNHFDMKRIEDQLMRRGALLVLMEDRPEAVVARFKALKEDFARDSDVYAILEAYDRLFRSSRLPKVRAALHQQLPQVVAALSFHMTWYDRTAEAGAKQ